MPPKKKQALSGPPAESEEEDDLTDDSSNDEQIYSTDSDASVNSLQEVQVEFDAREIEEADFDGIRRLLQQVFLKASVDLSALTSLIIAENRRIGSTIKICEDEEMDSMDDDGDCDKPGASNAVEGEGEDVLGVVSVVNLTQHKKTNCIKQLKELLLSQCKIHDGSKLAQFSALLTDASKQVGFLVDERFINIPVDIAPPLLRSLLTQLEDTSQHYPNQYSYDYYVRLARSHHPISPPKSQTGKKRKKKLTSIGATEASSTGVVEPSITFDSYEDELFHKASLVSFSYPVCAESDDLFGGQWDFEDSTLKPFRTVMVVNAPNLEEAIVELERTFKH